MNNTEYLNHKIFSLQSKYVLQFLLKNTFSEIFCKVDKAFFEFLEKHGPREMNSFGLLD